MHGVRKKRLDEKIPMLPEPYHTGFGVQGILSAH